jgi:hypothetical protein
MLVKGVGSVALRTVSVVLVNGQRRVRINALLDDASTRTFLNSDVAAELGLEGQTEVVNVRTLNGQVSTFQTSPVEVGVESLDGVFKTQVQAFTTEKVTGNLRAVDWSRLGKRWAHLRDIPFQSVRGRPAIDMLIGIDNADLHFSCREVGGDPGQPTARLTPIGWTCVGQLDSEKSLQQTLFCHDCENDAVQALRNFWAIEEVPEGGRAAGMTQGEQHAETIVKASLKLEDGRYQVAMPWKTEPDSLPDNRQMAMQRLLRTEKRLLKDEELAKAYKGVLQDHLNKGSASKKASRRGSGSCRILLSFGTTRRRPRRESSSTLRQVIKASA